jgi:hypothetical protein
MNHCIVLSGISGSGKSTQARLLVTKIPNLTYIEGDDYFLPTLPRITLSSGETARNWDSIESVDWDRLNTVVTKQLETSHVILATFLPLHKKFTFPRLFHIRLITGRNIESIIERCITTRCISKALPPEKEAIDELIVKECVIPLYLQVEKDENADM